MRRTFIIFAVLTFLTIALFLAFSSNSPSPSKVRISLADGTIFTLDEVEVGQPFYIGGKFLPRLLCKTFKRQLPSFIPYQPAIFHPLYTNGILLSMTRAAPGSASIQTPWNGLGNLYFLTASDTQLRLSQHDVNFTIETGPTGNFVASERIDWEMPLVHDPILHFRLYETNSVTGLTNHDFQIPNPTR